MEIAYPECHFLLVIPQIPFFDIEYANNIILVARVDEYMQIFLDLVQREAAKYNLFLNFAKTKLVLYNSDASIYFMDGSKIQKV